MHNVLRNMYKFWAEGGVSKLWGETAELCVNYFSSKFCDHEMGAKNNS